MSAITGLGYYDAKTLIKESNEYNKFTEDSEKRFNVLKKEDKHDFETYIFDTLKKLASIGCNSFEYQTDTNLKTRHRHFFTTLEQLGFKYRFYKLDQNLCNKKYNLLIDWN